MTLDQIYTGWLAGEEGLSITPEQVLQFQRRYERGLRDARIEADFPHCAHCKSTAIVTHLDGDDLCIDHANQWVRGEGEAAREREDLDT